MKRALLAAALGAAALAAAPSASAQLYFGAGVTAFQGDAAADDILLGAAMGRIGYEFTPYLAIEGEAALGIQDDDFSVLGNPVDVSLDNEFGGFLVAKLPLPLIDFFGRVGYADFSIDADPLGANLAPSGAGLAYGGGINFNVFFMRVRAEYTLYELDTGNLDSAGLSALLKF
jgi:hypothetical protein